MQRKSKAQIIEEDDSLSDEFVADDLPEGAQEETSIGFECKSIELVVINEYQGNFLPMILLLADKVGFNSGVTTVGEATKMKGEAETSVCMNYFNAPVGFWEPAIEKFLISVKLFGNGKAFKQAIEIVDPLNINISVGLAGVLANFGKLWTIAAEKAEKYEKMKALKEEKM